MDRPQEAYGNIAVEIRDEKGWRETASVSGNGRGKSNSFQQKSAFEVQETALWGEKVEECVGSQHKSEYR